MEQKKVIGKFLNRRGLTDVGSEMIGSGSLALQHQNMVKPKQASYFDSEQQFW
jgi:hypothetical protein